MHCSETLCTKNGLREVPHDGRASKEIVQSERQKEKKKGPAEGETGEEAETLLSAIPLSPVLPSIDSTD